MPLQVWDGKDDVDSDNSLVPPLVLQGASHITAGGRVSIHQPRLSFILTTAVILAIST